jgi:hypothetical protein
MISKTQQLVTLLEENSKLTHVDKYYDVYRLFEKDYE